MGKPSNGTLISYGPDENCTLALCPVTASVYEYRPSLAATITIMVLFAISMVICVAQSVRWRTWTFLFAMFWGYVSELVGYGGRIILFQNPFSFTGFMIQITCITLAPAFFSAAIYLTLSKIAIHLGREYSRFRPSLYYWIFIPCDLISLSLQGTGGGLSSNSHGSSQLGVDVAIAGLSFQVFTLTVFILLAADFGRLWYKGRQHPHEKTPVSKRFKIFVLFLSLAIVFILIRCCYRIDELSNGYSGPLIHNEGLFIGLEGVMIILATFALNIAHPGSVFDGASAMLPEDSSHDITGKEAVETRSG